jgi:HlyD family secretion protein
MRNSRPHTVHRTLARTLALALLLATPMLSSCDRNSGATTPTPTTSSASAASVRSVRVEPLQSGALTTTRTAAVTLRAAQESRVAAGASGRVMAIAAREGAAVAAGGLLMRIDDTNFRANLDAAELTFAQANVQLESAQRASNDALAQAQSAVRTTSQNLALVDRQLAEAEALLPLGGVARSDVDALRAQRSQAEGAQLQAQEALDRAQRAGAEDLALLALQRDAADVQRRNARVALAETEIRAPFAGEVAELFVEVGEFVAAGSPVVRLLGSGARIASFTVAPEDAARIEALGTVTVRYAGVEFPATIRRLERNAQVARLVTVLAELAPDAPPTAAGALAEAVYPITLGEGWLVNSGALFADAGRNYVLSVADGFARRIEVRVLAEGGNQAVVAAVEPDTLRAGMPIINPRPLDVRDGSAVAMLGQ